MTRGTEEQRQAITSRERTVLVQAGAGTGKTWTMVERYLYLLEEHPDWPLESLVAVTFTEKAARELRNRVRLGIEAHARVSPPDSHWVERRRGLERLAVYTIHQLCQRLLREHAIAAHLDPGFTVLGDMEAAQLREEALDLTLAQLAEEADESLSLLADMRTFDLQEQLADLLSRRATVSQLFETLPGKAELMERWRVGWEEMVRDMWAERMHANPLMAEALEQLPEIEPLAPDDLLVGPLRAAQQAIVLVNARDLPAALKAFGDMPSLQGGRKESWRGISPQELRNLLKALRDPARALLESNCGDPPGELDERAAEHLQLWRRAWQRLEAVYDDLKRQSQALDFDDLELRAYQLLTAKPQDDRLSAWIAGIRQIMVDEFQDTNQLQWEIVSRLVPPDGKASTFLVGDAKQSIYRFRQAQVEVFRQRVKESEGGRGQLGLTQSFRSQAPLVRALNHLFNQVMSPMGERHAEYEAEPGPLHADREPAPGQGRSVEVHLLPEAKDEEGKEKVLAEEGRLLEADIIAERLRELYETGYPVWDGQAREYRPFRYGDAAILMRATTSFPLYEERFRVHGLPYVAVTSRDYYKRPEVQDLVALLHALANPGDDLSLATVLRSPLFSLSDETLFRLRRRRPDDALSEVPIPLAQAIANPPLTDQADAVERARLALEDLWSRVGRESVWSLLRRALEVTGYEMELAREDREAGAAGRGMVTVQQLLRLAYEQGERGLTHFLVQMTWRKRAEVRQAADALAGQDQSAVQMMSIHAAKGLEFPVVWVPDTGRGEGRSGRTYRVIGDPYYGLVCQLRDQDGDWLKPVSYNWASWVNGRMEAAESKRLMYVACTRAADLLVVSGKPGGASDSWIEAIQQAWEISSLKAATPDEEPCERYGVRLHRHDYSHTKAPRRSTAEQAPREAGSTLAALPAGTGPLAPTPPAILSITRAIETLHPELTVQLRALSPQSARKSSWRRVGEVVHHALNHWACLEEPPEELRARLTGWALGGGTGRPRSVVSRAMRVLGGFRGSPLHREVERARHVWREWPVSARLGDTVLHGVVDLLYQDQAGAWHLLDFKSSYVKRGEEATRAAEHLTQLALYAHALAPTIGDLPEASVCFLVPDVRLHTWAADDLRHVWREAQVALGPEGLAGS